MAQLITANGNMCTSIIIIRIKHLLKMSKSFGCSREVWCTESLDQWSENGLLCFDRGGDRYFLFYYFKSNQREKSKNQLLNCEIIDWNILEISLLFWTVMETMWKCGTLKEGINCVFCTWVTVRWASIILYYYYLLLLSYYILIHLRLGKSNNLFCTKTK